MSIDITIFLLIALATSLNEAIKKVGGEKIKNFIPAIAIVVGFLFSFGYYFSGEYFEIVIIGLIIGLASTGLYEHTEKAFNGTKRIVDKIKNN